MKFNTGKEDLDGPEKENLAKSIISDNDADDMPALHHLHIKPAENGFMVETHHRAKPKKGDASPVDSNDDYGPTKMKRTVHADENSVAEHVRAHLRSHMKHHMKGK